MQESSTAAAAVVRRGTSEAAGEGGD